MRLSTAPLLAALFAAASVRAQDADANCTSAALSTIPACALPCFVHGAATIGCGGLDVACLCRQQAALLAAVEPCMATSCNATELQDALDGAEAGAQPHNRLLLLRERERDISTNPCPVCACANQNSQAAAASGSSAPSASVPPSVGPASTLPPTTTSSSPTHSATPSVVLGGAPRSRADMGLVVGAFFAFVLL